MLISVNINKSIPILQHPPQSLPPFLQSCFLLPNSLTLLQISSILIIFILFSIPNPIPYPSVPNAALYLSTNPSILPLISAILSTLNAASNPSRPLCLCASSLCYIFNSSSPSLPSPAVIFTFVCILKIR